MSYHSIKKKSINSQSIPKKQENDINIYMTKTINDEKYNILSYNEIDPKKRKNIQSEYSSFFNNPKNYLEINKNFLFSKRKINNKPIFTNRDEYNIYKPDNQKKKEIESQVQSKLKYMKYQISQKDIHVDNISSKQYDIVLYNKYNQFNNTDYNKKFDGIEQEHVKQKLYFDENKKYNYLINKTNNHTKECIISKKKSLLKYKNEKENSILLKKKNFISNLNLMKEKENNTFDYRDWFHPELKSKLKSQSNRIKSACIRKINNEEISKRLSSKIKRDESKLLFNNTNLTRKKREITSAIDSNHRKEEKFGDFLWYANLRINEKDSLAMVNSGLNKSKWEYINIKDLNRMSLLDRIENNKESIVNKVNGKYLIRKFIGNLRKNEYFKKVYSEIDKYKKDDENVIDKYLNSEKSINLIGGNLKKIEDEVIDMRRFILTKRYDKSLKEENMNVYNIEETII